MPTRDCLDGYALAPYPEVYSHPQIPRHLWVFGTDGRLYAVRNALDGSARRVATTLPLSTAAKRLTPDAARRALSFLGIPAEEVRLA
jgi:hypothetical protein